MPDCGILTLGAEEADPEGFEKPLSVSERGTQMPPEEVKMRCIKGGPKSQTAKTSQHDVATTHRKKLLASGLAMVASWSSGAASGESLVVEVSSHPALFFLAAPEPAEVARPAWRFSSGERGARRVKSMAK